MRAGSDQILSSFVAVATIVAGVPAVFVISQVLRSFYARTAGRRRGLERRLRRLGTGAQLAYFEGILGQQPAMRRALEPSLAAQQAADRDIGLRGRLRRSMRLRGPHGDAMNMAVNMAAPTNVPTAEIFYVEPEFVVQAIVDQHDTVLAYSITTRDERFRPTLDLPPRYRARLRSRLWLLIRYRYRAHAMVRVKLGRTRFDKAFAYDRGAVGSVSAWLTPRNGGFSEAHSLGNAGYYQTFVATASGAGRGRSFGDLHAVMEELGYDDFPSRWDESVKPYRDMPALRRFRAATSISTMTVIGPFFAGEDFPTSYGPHGDEIRLIP
jgi:hypothetical protein